MVMMVVAMAAGCRGSSTEATVPAGAAAADIYAEVLHRYLTTPAESSFPTDAFLMVYVLDRSFPGGGESDEKRGAGLSIPVDTQRRVVSALASTSRVSFISDRRSVIVERNACAQVKGQAILVTLGSPAGAGDVVRVGINGFVACHGATWLTYLVESVPGAGWRVTGVEGHRAAA